MSGTFFFFSFLKKIYFSIFYFLAVLSLHCCLEAFSSCGEPGYCLFWGSSFSLQCLLLWSMRSRCAGFSSCGSWALELGLRNCEAQA